MNALDRIRLRLRPPKLEDPDFGHLLYMYVRLNPEKSYWEARWRFPPMGTGVSLTLPGPVAGPLAESKSFYALLASRFETLLALGVPKIEQVFKKLFIEN